jgi:hypothetical protein
MGDELLFQEGMLYFYYLRFFMEMPKGNYRSASPVA